MRPGGACRLSCSSTCMVISRAKNVNAGARGTPRRHDGLVRYGNRARESSKDAQNRERPRLDVIARVAECANRSFKTLHNSFEHAFFANFISFAHTNIFGIDYYSSRDGKTDYPFNSSEFEYVRTRSSFIAFHE